MVLENQGSPRQCAGMMLVVAQHAAETDLERPEYQTQEESEAAESTEKEVIAAPSEQAEPSAAVSWHEAVLLTLTLDVDFNLIGDHEAFKQDVIKDVATAANVHAKYMKIAALRAGSVIVDMLIASEAGEATKIVQGLVEQLMTPDSPLMRGKFTSKTKSLNPSPDAVAESAKRRLASLLAIPTSASTGSMPPLVSPPQPPQVVSPQQQAPAHSTRASTGSMHAAAPPPLLSSPQPPQLVSPQQQAPALPTSASTGSMHPGTDAGRR